MRNNKIKVAFLDRDGVINKEVNYLSRFDDFEYTDNCIKALKCLAHNDFKIIIITNQAGIAKGYYTENQYFELTNFYIEDLKLNGVDILDVFHCPHHPDGVLEEYKIACNCRKPSAGLINKALAKYSVDLEQSLLVGDKVSDVQAGAAAGLTNNYLVRSGHQLPTEFVRSSYKNLYQLVREIF